MKIKDTMKKLLERIKKFLFPGPDATPRMLILPYATLGILTILLIAGGIHGWEYSNSPEFCGTACHTMIPQDVVYQESPHANVTCEECHIGRTSFFTQLMRKTQGIKESYYEIFKLYEYPLHASALRPARDTCEKCHQPEAFSDDSLRVLPRFVNDTNNSQNNIYLILKTGGGAKREGLGRGIHWHIVNTVEFYATDPLAQDIPYVRVQNEDGSFTEYVDVESGFDVSTLDEEKLQPMDCITCHNRITHEFTLPTESVDVAMSRGLIDPDIPQIHQKAVEVLFVEYETRDEAFAAFDGLDEYYKTTDYYAGNSDKVSAAIQEIKDIYDRTVFHDQEVDWATHPNNLGHINSPGCFRCHDGGHLNAQDEAIRLECNVCHSIPVVAGPDDFVTKIEISRGPEPESHFNPNWISLHNEAFGTSCATCHTMDDPGGTSDTSFCSNSACHGNVYTFAGFDAPALREILKAQLPAPEPVDGLPVLTGAPTYDNYIGALFTARCSKCHGDLESGGLNLLTYDGAMNGGENGAVIVPGDSANSILFQLQSAGEHFANLVSDELEIVRQWIDDGAPEN
ncbi:MAG TPA: NapC/NirT family cytochrome c [Anaerolineales bacterium]|nr:NapC/NirT family cytochrome c [Anaerolineales bacterium]